MSDGPLPGSQPRSKSRRFAEFDALRGVAALAVALDHWRRMYHGRGEIPHFTPFRLLFIGHGCVLLFFALSGLVLSLPQMAGRGMDYPAFVVKRVLRIYPAYLIALGLAVAACARWHGSDFYGHYFTTSWGQAPDAASVLDAVTLFGSYDFHRYNVAYWTLTQEMRLSLLVPLLCLLVLGWQLRAIALLIAAITGLAIALEKRWGLPEDVVRTVAYLAVFLVGSLCARHLNALNRRVAEVPRRLYWALVLLLLGVMTGWPTVMYHLRLRATAWDVLLGLVAAAVIVLSLRPDGISRPLHHPALQFLGKISYSIYLLHGTVLWIFAYLFIGRCSPLVWLPGFLAVTLLVSWGFYTAVEVPSIAMGRSAESMMKRRRARREQAAPALEALLPVSEAALPVFGESDRGQLA